MSEQLPKPGRYCNYPGICPEVVEDLGYLGASSGVRYCSNHAQIYTNGIIDITTYDENEENFTE